MQALNEAVYKRDPTITKKRKTTVNSANQSQKQKPFLSLFKVLSRTLLVRETEEKAETVEMREKLTINLKL